MYGDSAEVPLLELLPDTELNTGKTFTANILLSRLIIAWWVCMPASCVQTLGGTAALLVSDRTSSLLTMSQSVSQSGRQNSPPIIRVNQMGVLPVTPHQKVKRSVNCWCSSRDAPGEEQGVCNNKHNKCSVSANMQLTHTFQTGPNSWTFDQMSPHVNVNNYIPHRQMATGMSTAAFLCSPITQGDAARADNERPVSVPSR